MLRPCLTNGCPNLTPRTYCHLHHRTQAQRGYGAAWQRTSKQAIAASPRCVVCGTSEDLTTDHTTGWVVCRVHHRSEAQGGVARVLDREGR